MVGAEACTVFCGLADPALVVADLERRLSLDPVGPEWARVRATAPEGAVVLTRLMFAPGSRFSGIVLGTLTAVRRGTEQRPGARDDVVAHLQTCDMILGVRFEPTTVPDDARVAAVLAVAAVTGGMVLDAGGVLAADGEPLVAV